jgi:co-chaperonin GroES (HSP10)
MKTVNNIFYLDIDTEANQKVKYGSLELHVDTTFDELRHAVQCGIVKHSPEVLVGEHYGKECPRVGDKVYFHHRVHGTRHERKWSQKIELNGEQMFWSSYSDLYCIVRDGKVIMLDEWIFVRPVIEEVASPLLLDQTAKVSRKEGVVVHTNASSAENDIHVGDCVFFQKDADYDMVVEGEKLLRMKNGHLYAKKQVA